jgi:hypothetical protein
MAKTITVDISPAGSIKIEASGFKGKECDKATEQLELVLGGGQVKKDRKPEFFAPVGATQGTRLTF